MHKSNRSIPFGSQMWGIIHICRRSRCKKIEYKLSSLNITCTLIEIKMWRKSRYTLWKYLGRSRLKGSIVTQGQKIWRIRLSIHTIMLLYTPMSRWIKLYSWKWLVVRWVTTRYRCSWSSKVRSNGGKNIMIKKKTKQQIKVTIK